MRLLAYWIARVLRGAARRVEKLGSSQSLVVQRTMGAYDMVADPDEAYYTTQYLHWLRIDCERHFSDGNARVLDVGCGQGRLALALADWFPRGRVVGVDFTPASVEQARRYVAERGTRNIEIHESDALEFVRALPAGGFDLAVMTEVAFVMPGYRDVLAAIARALKPRGLLCASFRGQYFNLLTSVRSRDWQSARLVRDAREGQLGGATWLAWQTPAEVRQLLSEAGFTNPQLRGIGIASGIAGDPLSLIAQPSRLPAADRATLNEIETSLAEEYVACGRYILATAIKSA